LIGDASIVPVLAVPVPIIAPVSKTLKGVAVTVAVELDSPVA
jgi:hypothetical protein